MGTKSVSYGWLKQAFSQVERDSYFDLKSQN